MTESDYRPLNGDAAKPEMPTTTSPVGEAEAVVFRNKEEQFTADMFAEIDRLRAENARLSAEASYVVACEWRDKYRAAESARVKLQAFKDYVHRRLDECGVSPDPDSPHKAEGCRIGGRLDELIARPLAVYAEMQKVVAARDSLQARLDCVRETLFSEGTGQ